LDWSGVTTEQELLLLRTKQLARRDEDLNQAVEQLHQSREQTAKDYLRKHHLKNDNNLQPGTMVLVYEVWQDNQYGNKGISRWNGPYLVVKRRHTGSYILAELSGTVIARPFAATRIKIFYDRNSQSPIVRKSLPEAWKDLNDTYQDPKPTVDEMIEDMEQSDESLEEIREVNRLEQKSRKNTGLTNNPAKPPARHRKQKHVYREDYKDDTVWIDVWNRWMMQKSSCLATLLDNQHEARLQQRIMEAQEDSELYDWSWDLQQEKFPDDIPRFTKNIRWHWPLWIVPA
jgi:hypothetical protein